jgi:hypothetical protein
MKYQKKKIFIGSVDGTVCVLDIEQLNEDDTLISGFNLEDSINKIDFIGENYDFISFLTNSERFSLWNMDGTRLFDYGDKRKELSIENFHIDYFICCKWNLFEKKLFLISGNHQGGIGIISIHNNELKLISTLIGGHISTVRSFYWNFEVY